MYSIILILHSWLRWAALAAGLGATLTALPGSESSSSPVDRWGLAFVVVLDLQLLLGLILYLGLSPSTTAAFRDFGAAMQSPSLRFWAVEHSTMMLAAVALAHVGRVLARKAKRTASKRVRLVACFGLATLAMIAAIPWPGTANARPLFRI